MFMRSIVRDLKDNITENVGNVSRRTFSFRFPHSGRVRSQSAVLESLSSTIIDNSKSCWANLPPELLRDVLQRVESAEDSWPSRKDVVACSAVCKTWREITMELVKTPEESGMLTFPISLKQVTNTFLS